MTLGGTWWENTYPGCACDVPAHLYSFSFAPNPEWSRMFAPQPEILAYLQRVARDHGVLPQIRFGTEMRSARWDEAEHRWMIETAAGSFAARRARHRRRPAERAGAAGHRRARALRGADVPFGPVGPRRRPARPARRGHRHRRVVGAVHPARAAARLAPDGLPAHAGLGLPAPGLPAPARAALGLPSFPTLAARRARSASTTIAETLVYGLTKNPNALKPNEAIARWNLHRAVKDPELRAKLTPDYRIGCKRIIFANDYFPALAQPNVELVTAADPRGRRRRRRHRGRRPPRRRHDHPRHGLSGLRATRSSRASSGATDARSLSVWRAHGAQAYRGTAVAGFPNHFVIIGPNTGLGNNSMINIIEGQLDLVVDAIATMEREQPREHRRAPRSPGRGTTR